jgi:hypothetical protein
MPLYARLWTDVLGDPKLMRAVDEGAKHLMFLPWLIAFAKRADASGRLEIAGKPATSRQIARDIPNATPRAVDRCQRELRTIGILTNDPDGCFRFASWDFRNSSKASDSKEAIAERVRKHRDRKKADVTPNGNALQGVTDVTDVTSRRVESREKRGESREKRDKKKAGSSGKDSLPAAAVEFARAFYRAAPTDRKQDVYRQLMATLNGGARLRRGVIVTAGSVERLEVKCREVIQEGVDDPDKAIVVLLTKLADSTDIASQRREEVREEIVESDRIGADRRAAAAAFANNHPEKLGELRDRALREFPGAGEFHDLTRSAWVVQQLATLASAEPMDPHTTDGAHEPF